MALPSIKNSVGMAVTAVADAGEGTLTVGAALSGGYQTAATAYGANANIDIRIEEGDTWEICRDCTYTHSGTTVTRGTQEDGSSGTSTRVAFTSAAKVYVVESAERMRRTVGGYLEHSSHDGTAAVTGVVGTMHVFTALTADRNFTLPASAQAGDRIGITFPAGSASYEILLKSASGDKINNVDCSSTEWSRLFIAGETVIFRCVDASTVDWIVEFANLKPQQAIIQFTASDRTSSSTGWNDTFFNTQDIAVGATVSGLSATVEGAKIKVRRNGLYMIACTYHPKAGATSADNEQIGPGVMLNGSASTGTFVLNGASSSPGTAPKPMKTIRNVQLTADDYIQGVFYAQTTGGLGQRGLGVFSNALELVELL